MIVLTASLIVTIAGLLAYALSANPKVQEMGKWYSVVGMLVTLLSLSTAVTHVVVK